MTITAADLVHLLDVLVRKQEREPETQATAAVLIAKAAKALIRKVSQ